MTEDFPPCRHPRRSSSIEYDRATRIERRTETCGACGDVQRTASAPGGQCFPMSREDFVDLGIAWVFDTFGPPDPYGKKPKAQPSRPPAKQDRPRAQDGPSDDDERWRRDNARDD